MRYIDSHSHLYFPQFDADRDEVMARMRAHNVTTVAVGTGYKTSRSAVQSAIDMPDIVVGATVGVHPTAYQEGFRDTDFESFFKNHERTPGAPRLVVGVGECGLDYFRGATEGERRAQHDVFAAQIEFALKHDLPLMLHVRPSPGEVDAHMDALALLSHYATTHGGRLRGTAHFFTAPLFIARKYWGLGFATSFPGVITFAPETAEVVREAPQEYILAETDAPYATPVPHRGKRNEPLFVQEVVRHIGALRSEEVAFVAEYTYNNTQRIFLTV